MGKRLGDLAGVDGLCRRGSGGAAWTVAKMSAKGAPSRKREGEGSWWLRMRIPPLCQAGNRPARNLRHCLWEQDR
jgi:hypothetical protein